MVTFVSNRLNNLSETSYAKTALRQSKYGAESSKIEFHTAVTIKVWLGVPLGHPVVGL